MTRAERWQRVARFAGRLAEAAQATNFAAFFDDLSDFDKAIRIAYLSEGLRPPGPDAPPAAVERRIRRVEANAEAAGERAPAFGGWTRAAGELRALAKELGCEVPA